ncbi:MAG: transcription antitermination factor NusB [Clostridiales bacterium]|nr:transcription antitermination factor NusB [Clostridiales bacterium]
MTRREARELSMQVLFEMHIKEEYDINILNYHLNDKDVDELQKDYIINIIKTTIDNMVEINNYIEKYAIGWTLNRIANVDLVILQLTIAEILYNDDIPYNVSINEAIELAKKFSGKDSYSFINGILGKFIIEENIKEDVQ